MDGRNVFVAIALSLAVLLLAEVFIKTPKPENSIQENVKIDKKKMRKTK